MLTGLAVSLTWRGLSGMRLWLVVNTMYNATKPNVVKRLTGMERIDPPT